MIDEVEHMLEALGHLHAVTEIPIRMSGLRKGEFSAMIRLDGSEACESSPDALGLTVSQLSRELGISPAGVSQMVNSLVTKGYVARVPDERDRRVVRLLLTEQGRDLTARAKEGMCALARKILAKMGEEDASRFVQYLDHASAVILEEIRSLQTQGAVCPNAPAQRKEISCEST